MFFAEKWEIKDKVFLTNLRHKTALDKALATLASARHSIASGLPSDFILIDLKSCLDFLGEITGETVDEEVINQIFSQFCLGK